MKKQLLAIPFLIATLVSAIGCGGDGGSVAYNGGIRTVSFRDSTTSINGKNSFRVEIELGAVGTDEENLDSEAFDLAIRLPENILYVPGSSKITDSILGDSLFGNPDRRSPDQVSSCAQGSFILYRFRQDEFGDPTALDSSSIVVKVDLSPTAELKNALVQAEYSRFGIADPCTVASTYSATISTGN